MDSDDEEAPADNVKNLKSIHIVMELCKFSLDYYMKATVAPPTSNRRTQHQPLDALQRARILQQVRRRICNLYVSHSKSSDNTVM